MTLYNGCMIVIPITLHESAKPVVTPATHQPFVRCLQLAGPYQWCTPMWVRSTAEFHVFLGAGGMFSISITALVRSLQLSKFVAAPAYTVKK